MKLSVVVTVLAALVAGVPTDNPLDSNIAELQDRQAHVTPPAVVGGLSATLSVGVRLRAGRTARIVAVFSAIKSAMAV
ncbi:uncharacterized protein EI97DRAFT_459227 [Westerdykella ornata]|uniref:Uncharacterized protein n=1 Tax=Westerdykella ornata TaxID=318751 RepID=A0A6A6JFX0_WESOR|nr:uncharacterized protein EI97DRAFT_459227 [Westerdykella ornata]KAF2275312.1 hypothetical protein EI97DRAFT_459227 [Westerdykella ornata]